MSDESPVCNHVNVEGVQETKSEKRIPRILLVCIVLAVVDLFLGLLGACLLVFNLRQCGLFAQVMQQNLTFEYSAYKLKYCSINSLKNFFHCLFHDFLAVPTRIRSGIPDFSRIFAKWFVTVLSFE